MTPRREIAAVVSHILRAPFLTSLTTQRMRTTTKAGPKEEGLTIPARDLAAFFASAKPSDPTCTCTGCGLGHPSDYKGFSCDNDCPVPFCVERRTNFC